MTKSEIFKAAHKIANEIQGDLNIKSYRKAFSLALRKVWLRFSQINKVKNLPSWLKEKIKPSLYTENMDVIELLKPLSWKSWKVGMGVQMMFSPDLVQASI